MFKITLGKVFWIVIGIGVAVAVGALLVGLVSGYADQIPETVTIPSL